MLRTKENWESDTLKEGDDSGRSRCGRNVWGWSGNGGNHFKV